jgi:16S rRNA (cytidine1402-2'-O)-methyltransferase
MASAGTLYVVATPIGNLEDITLRALRVLRAVDLVACEDTRRTAQLLRAHGIAARTTSFFEHNERWKGGRLLDELREGRSVALVSDAGTPAISDPGFRLVRDARAAGLPVVPVPGANAAIAALSVCGLPTDRFLFVGFLPARPGARQRAVEALRARQETLVLYESPVRLTGTLDDLAAALGDRSVFFCREATKAHEEYLRTSLHALAEEIGRRGTVRGEVVLVIAGAGTSLEATESPEAVFSRLVGAGLTRRAAVKEAARVTGLPAREVYRRTLDS